MINNQKTVVTISRKWHSPHITTKINSEEIALSIDLNDFQEALLKELDSVTWTFTKKQLREKLQAAVFNVIEGIKEESAKVVG